MARDFIKDNELYDKPVDFKENKANWKKIADAYATLR